MELQGKIIFALPPKTGTSTRGEWKVQEFVLETLDGQFTRKMVFSVFGEDKLQRFNIQVGQDVSVLFDIDAREYQGRWFNSIRAYDVRPIANVVQAPDVAAAAVANSPFANAAGVPQQPAPQQAAPQQPGTQVFPQQSTDPFASPNDGNADDLPF